MYKEIALKPRLSEKSYAQSANRVYVFAVPSDANKHSVARAVEAQFDVKVTGVNILNLKGKAKRTVSQKGRRQLSGSTSDTKKAYVTLAEGNSLPIFAAEEEAEAKQEKVQAQVDKAAAKVADKEAKEAAKKAKKDSKEGK
jgi:large subunit ribosomal protein L23